MGYDPLEPWYYAHVSSERVRTPVAGVKHSTLPGSLCHEWQIELYKLGVAQVGALFFGRERIHAVGIG